MSLLPIVIDGVPMLDLALVFSLFFRDGHTRTIRTGLGALLQEYWEICGPHLRFSAASANADEGPAWRKMDAATVKRIADLVLNAREMTPWEFRLCGGEKTGHASPFFINAMGRGVWQQDMGRLSRLNLALPWTWYADHRGNFPDLFRRACEVLQPCHGYGGLGFAYALDLNRMREMEADVFYMASGTPSLIVENWIFDAVKLEHGTREGNWLTVLHDELLAKLGGAEMVERALGEGFICRRHSGGMTIQAGDEPNPGGPSIYRPAPPDPQALPEDAIWKPPMRRNAAELYPLYHRLNQVLKPIRVTDTDFQSGLQSGEFEKTYYFNHERSMQWMARFD